MALKATIFKAVVNVADTDRGVYLDETLTLARHPSETDERLMVRLLAWGLNASPDLEFTKGLCADDEPDLWRKELHGDIAHWIEVGLPDERRLKRACNRAAAVTLYAYGARAAQVWWQQNQSQLAKLDNLSVYFVDDELAQALASRAERNMSWQLTVSDGLVWLSSDGFSTSWQPICWQAATH